MNTENKTDSSSSDSSGEKMLTLERLTEIRALHTNCEPDGRNACQTRALLDHIAALSATIKRLETKRGDWSKLRSAINACRDDIKGAANATSYEMESAYFDSIARTLADALSLNSVAIKAKNAALEQQITDQLNSVETREMKP